MKFFCFGKMYRLNDYHYGNQPRQSKRNANNQSEKGILAATGGFENENAPEMIGSDTPQLSTS